MDGIKLRVEFLPDQVEVAKYWNDKESKEIVFGGSKAGGKSYLGCALIFGNALLYDGTFYFIARKELNDLRRFTRPSIHEFFEKVGLKWTEYAKYNGQDNVYELKNGSKVYLLHAKETPDDPLFERFGSLQFTQGWIEEAGEFVEIAASNLRISVGRWKNKEYDLMGKILMTCNPKKNFLFDQFYEPHKSGTLPKDRKFVQTYPWRNPFLSLDYIENLAKLKDSDTVAYQRLYKGNWDYADDTTALFEFDDIQEMFVQKPFIQRGSKTFLTVDPSGKGKDRTVIMVFRGYKWIERIYSFAQISSKDLVETIKAIQGSLNIPNRLVIYDDDGIGHYIGSYIPGAYAFKGGAVPYGSLGKKNYPNRRTQLYYELSALVRSSSIFINENRREIKKRVSRDLSAIRADKVDDDKLKYILPKKEIIKILGISPDYADCLMMGLAGARIKTSLSNATA